VLLCKPVTSRIDSTVYDGGCGLDRLGAASRGEKVCQTSRAGSVCQMAQSPVVLECPERGVLVIARGRSISRLDHGPVLDVGRRVVLVPPEIEQGMKRGVLEHVRSQERAGCRVLNCSRTYDELLQVGVARRDTVVMHVMTIRRSKPEKVRRVSGVGGRNKV